MRIALCLTRSAGLKNEKSSDFFDKMSALIKNKNLEKGRKTKIKVAYITWVCSGKGFHLPFLQGIRYEDESCCFI